MNGPPDRAERYLIVAVVIIGAEMSQELDLAAQYQKHAKALRAAAVFDADAKSSLVLKRIAQEYELMARALENEHSESPAR